MTSCKQNTHLSSLPRDELWWSAWRWNECPVRSQTQSVLNPYKESFAQNNNKGTRRMLFGGEVRRTKGPAQCQSCNHTGKNYTSRVQRDAIVRIAVRWTLWLAYNQRRSRIVAVCHCYENIQSSSFAPSIFVHARLCFTPILASTKVMVACTGTPKTS